MSIRYAREKDKTHCNDGNTLWKLTERERENITRKGYVYYEL